MDRCGSCRALTHRAQGRADACRHLTRTRLSAPSRSCRRHSFRRRDHRHLAARAENGQRRDRLRRSAARRVGDCLGWSCARRAAGDGCSTRTSSFPRRDTLAYSEALLLPGIAVAPIVWMTKNPILALNILLLAGYVLSGLATFVLVRALTGRSGAALVAAVIFAIYPYRIEQFAHVPKQLTFWWPLALLAIHRLVNTPRWRPAVARGVAPCGRSLHVPLQRHFRRHCHRRHCRSWRRLLSRHRVRSFAWLACSAAMVVALVLPLAGRYLTASRVVGVRSFGEVTFWSAELVDYRRAHPENARYGDDRHPGPAERRLFPGYVAPVLALAAFVPPIAPVTWAYAAGGLAAFDLSLGANGPGYRWLYQRFTPLQALRVPARFGMLVGLVLAVLAGLRCRADAPRARTRSRGRGRRAHRRRRDRRKSDAAATARVARRSGACCLLVARRRAARRRVRVSGRESRRPGGPSGHDVHVLFDAALDAARERVQRIRAGLVCRAPGWTPPLSR